MSQTLHQIYQSKAIVLARTMVVKFHSIAEAINQTSIDQGYEVDVNMFTDLDTLNEALQPLVGSVCILNKATSKKGFVSYTFSNGEGE